MIDITKSILAIKSDAQVSIEDNDVTKITWHDDNPTNITNEQILSKQLELQAEYDAKQYQRDRVYPSIGDQLDMQYKDLLNGTTTWKDAVAKVKSDNPKN
jgi:hypothetical protein